MEIKNGNKNIANLFYNYCSKSRECLVNIIRVNLFKENFSRNSWRSYAVIFRAFVHSFDFVNT